jgi:hypothetical protein
MIYAQNPLLGVRPMPESIKKKMEQEGAAEKPPIDIKVKKGKSPISVR